MALGHRPLAAAPLAGYPVTGANQTVTVPLSTVVVAAHAPTVTQQTNTPVSVPAANIVVATNAPTVNRTQSILVPEAPIIVNAYAPTLTQTGVISAQALAELYGGNIFTQRREKAKRKKEEEKPPLETMVFEVAKTTEGKKEIIEALPKPIQGEFSAPQLALVEDLIAKIENASAQVQKKVEQIYKQRQDDEDEDDVFILLM